MESPENINLESISAADIMSDKEHEAWMIEQANRTAYKPTTALILMYVYIIWPIIDVSGVTGKFSLLSLMGKPEDVMVYISMTYACIFVFLLFMTMAAVDRLWSSEEFRASVLIRNRIQKHLSPRYNADGTKKEPKEDQDQKYDEIMKDRKILHQRLTRQVREILEDLGGTDEVRKLYKNKCCGCCRLPDEIHKGLGIFDRWEENEPEVWYHKLSNEDQDLIRTQVNNEYLSFAAFAFVLGNELQRSAYTQVYGRKLMDVYRCVDLRTGNHINEATVLTHYERISLFTGGTLERKEKSDISDQSIRCDNDGSGSTSEAAEVCRQSR